MKAVMNRNKFRVVSLAPVLLLVAAAGLYFVASGGTNNVNNVVGKWVYQPTEDDEEQIVFVKDGTFVAVILPDNIDVGRLPARTIRGIYFVDRNKGEVTINITDPPGVPDSQMTWEVSVSGKTLIATFKDGGHWKRNGTKARYYKSQ